MSYHLLHSCTIMVKAPGLDELVMAQPWFSYGDVARNLWTRRRSTMLCAQVANVLIIKYSWYLHYLLHCAIIIHLIMLLINVSLRKLMMFSYAQSGAWLKSTSSGKGNLSRLIEPIANEPKCNYQKGQVARRQLPPLPHASYGPVMIISGYALFVHGVVLHGMFSPWELVLNEFYWLAMHLW